MKLCKFKDCGRRFYARNLCDPHYQQRKKGRRLHPIGMKCHNSRLRPYESVYRKLVRTAAHCARAGRTMSYKSFLSFVGDACGYCGTALDWSPFAQPDCARYNLDRVNNKRGYTKQNCVACCWDCNRLKGSTDAKSFLTLVNRIAQNWRLRYGFQNTGRNPT